ncbi:NUDIX hydrolase [Niabella ginsenosidivorans]|uniref:NUDIX hydrolase n=1 Tax=Niabella ginsenosidivorans TaxID=1176587 RepID=A0A1A9I032_9BACT|nr:NUDIX domain-containing protein [Niabella ginsenosidivorans]ANH81017.1 NUDIX hydrolase [Niabella ginsenosidivorans]
MQIKIHIHNKVLYLCDSLNELLQELLHHPKTIFIDELDTHSVKAMLHELTLPGISTGIFQHKDLKQLKKAFFRKFELIRAGGGLVTNERNEVLMIFRRGFWDLPKGKLDEGETIEECAVREVQEETGLIKLERGPLLLTTYHTYEQGTHQIIKESCWFKMKATAAEILIPQTEEDIEQIEWVPVTAVSAYKAKAYAAIADVLDAWALQQ